MYKKLNQIDISVIVPCYNCESTIEETYRTIMDAERNFDVEVIMINDGSTDSTLDKLNEICLINPNVKIINSENKGVSSARNLGINEAKGTYLFFVDSDDRVDENLFSVISKSIKEKNCDLVIFGYQSRSLDLKIKNDYRPEKKSCCLRTENFGKYAKDNSIINPCFNKVYKRKLIIDNNIFFTEGIKIGEDAIFNREYILKTKSIFISNEVYYYYYIHSDSAMRSLADDYDDQLKNCRSKKVFLDFFDITFDENSYFVKNAYHKLNFIYNKYPKNYKEFSKVFKKYMIYIKVSNLDLKKVLTLDNSTKIKFILVKYYFFAFYIKKFFGGLN